MQVLDDGPVECFLAVFTREQVRVDHVVYRLGKLPIDRASKLRQCAIQGLVRNLKLLLCVPYPHSRRTQHLQQLIRWAVGMLSGALPHKSFQRLHRRSLQVPWPAVRARRGYLLAHAAHSVRDRVHLPLRDGGESVHGRKALMLTN